VPTGLFVPVNGNHVVGKDFSKLELAWMSRLNFLNVDLMSLKVSSLKSCGGLCGTKIADGLVD
jgi:hypothetical protein